MRMSMCRRSCQGAGGGVAQKLRATCINCCHKQRALIVAKAQLNKPHFSPTQRLLYRDVQLPLHFGKGNDKVVQVTLAIAVIIEKEPDHCWPWPRPLASGHCHYSAPCQPWPLAALVIASLGHWPCRDEHERLQYHQLLEKLAGKTLFDYPSNS